MHVSLMFEAFFQNPPDYNSINIETTLRLMGAPSFNLLRPLIPKWIARIAYGKAPLAVQLKLSHCVVCPLPPGRVHRVVPKGANSGLNGDLPHPTGWFPVAHFGRHPLNKIANLPVLLRVDRRHVNFCALARGLGYASRHPEDSRCERLSGLLEFGCGESA